MPADLQAPGCMVPKHHMGGSLPHSPPGAASLPGELGERLPPPPLISGIPQVHMPDLQAQALFRPFAWARNADGVELQLNSSLITAVRTVPPPQHPVQPQLGLHARGVEVAQRRKDT